MKDKLEKAYQDKKELKEKMAELKTKLRSINAMLPHHLIIDREKALKQLEAYEREKDDINNLIVMIEKAEIKK